MSTSLTYQRIVAGLCSEIDPERFEHCVCDIFRDTYPDLAQVVGGSDHGIDGVLPLSDGRTLICTTGRDVPRNLRSSLKQQNEHFPGNNTAILVTSRSLTPANRAKLNKDASEYGFTLDQIYDQRGVANRLLKHPQWCKTLLNIDARPPVLSKRPLASRTEEPPDLQQRERETRHLHDRTGDMAVIGQPGSGKTCLVEDLALHTNAYFICDWDREALASDLRELSPDCLIYDDAHVDPSCILRLRQIRDEIGAHFRIVVTSWPSRCDEVRANLDIDNAGCISLERFDRDQMAELVTSLFHKRGYIEPVEIRREIVDQARGRPGLATELVESCIRQGSGDLIRGAWLSQYLNRAVRRIAGQDMSLTLAVLALGGDNGVDPGSAATILGTSPVELTRQLSELAYAGVIEEVGTRVAVVPARLRSAVIDSGFYGGPTAIRIDSAIERCDIPPTDALEVLVRTAVAGTPIPDRVMRELVEKADSERAWTVYANLGRSQADECLNARPDLLLQASAPLLTHTTDRTIDALLRTASGCDLTRDALRNDPRHPLRLLSDWVEAAQPGTGIPVARRAAVLQGVKVTEVDNPAVLVQAASTIISLRYSNAERGAGISSFVISDGHLTKNEYEEVAKLWPDVFSVIRAQPTTSWNVLLQSVSDWMFPGRLSPKAAPDFADQIREKGYLMLKDLMEERPFLNSLRRWANQQVILSGFGSTFPIDHEFEILYPSRDIGRNITEWEENRASEARGLANRWASFGMEYAASRFVEHENDALIIGKEGPGFELLVAQALSEAFTDKASWFSMLESAEAPTWLLHVALDHWAKEGSDDWKEIARSWLQVESQDRLIAACQVIVSRDDVRGWDDGAIAEILSDAVECVGSWTLRGIVRESWCSRMLATPGSDLSTSVAINLSIRAPEQSLSADLEMRRRQALVKAIPRHGSLSHHLREELESDMELAELWFGNCLEYIAGVWLGDFEVREVATRVAATFPADSRERWLKEAPAESLDDDLVSALVGGEKNLYESLLKRDDLGRVRHAPLGAWNYDRISGVPGYEGPPADQWIVLAKCALDHGVSEEEVSHRAVSIATVIHGSGVEQWEQRRDAMSALQTTDDYRIQRIAEDGYRIANSQYERAMEEDQALRFGDGW